MIMYTKAKVKRSSSQERCKGLSIAALVISLVLISATVFLKTMAGDSFAQGANNNTTASTNKTGTTSGNVTAQVVPQGTSLNTSNKTTASAANESGTTSGNVTAQVVPQGTSLNTSNKTTASAANESGTTSGNVTAQVVPQGTSLNTS